MKKGLVTLIVLLFALSSVVFADGINLTDQSTWGGLISSVGNSTFIVNGDVTLNGDNFSTTSSRPVFIFNGSYLLDCGGATISGVTSGTGVLSRFSNTKIQNCVFKNFGRDINILDIVDASYSVSTLYQSSYNSVWHDSVVDAAGNYITVGSNYYDFYVIKNAPNGTILWSRVYDYSTGGDDVDGLFGIEIDNDGNYVLVGRAKEGWYIEKMDPDGSTIWQRKYVHPTGSGIARDVAIDSNGDYVVVGGAGTQWGIIRITPSNSIEYSDSFGTGGAYGVDVDHEDYYVIVGKTADGYPKVLRVSSSGVTDWVWNASYAEYHNNLYDVAVDLDGNYVAVGGDRYGGSITKWRLMKFEPDGNLLFSRSYSAANDERAECVAVDQDNNYLVGGSYVAEGAFDSEMALRKFDSENGDVLYSWHRGASSNEEIVYGVDVSHNGDVLFAGKAGTYRSLVLLSTQSKNQMSGVTIINTSALTDGRGTFISFPNGNVNFQNFTCSHTGGSGKIVYDSVSGASGALSSSRNIEANPKFVSLDSFSSEANDFNIAATLTIESESGECVGHYFRASGFHTSLESVLENGEVFVPDYATCENGITTFTTTGFSGYAYGGNANLTINDSAEGSYVENNTSADFFAYYVNITNGALITGATCQISFDDGTGPFAMDESAGYYNYSKSFSSSGNHNWNVTCSKTGITTLFAEDDILVQTMEEYFLSIPEFSTWTLLMGLMVVIGGFLAVRRQE